MNEQWISVFGLLALMGVAYLFSVNRRAVNFRTVVWGVALQGILAAITLGNPSWISFAGMFVLLALVMVFLSEAPLTRMLGSKVAAWAVAVVGSGAAAQLACLLQPTGITRYLAVVAGLGWLAGMATSQSRWVRGCFGVILISSFGELRVRGVDGQQVFAFVSDKVKAFLDLSGKGSEFLFGNLAKGEFFFPGSATWPGFGFQFAFSVLPTIIFFSAFMSILYHLGLVHLVIQALARFMRWSMGTSGSETMSCCANVFVGQTEAPFLVKPYLNSMTKSELHAIMVGGFATIAGGVLAGYVKMGVNPGHLIAASVMSAPAALVIAKLLYPETEKSATAGDVDIPKVKVADNLVGAAANGVTDGLQLALNVGAMLIAFIALVAFVDLLMGSADAWIDGTLGGGVLNPLTNEYAGIFPGSLKTLFGNVFGFVAYLMGVPWADKNEVGNLLGLKITANEFLAYQQLGTLIEQKAMSPRAITVATYALCGFANFSSIGIQIGGIGALAPDRRGELARLGLRAMWGGALASWMTATMAGMLLRE
ncbi:MAG: NupC/NupG family nucleoside CNT transporter [Planctomycetota bacterium]